MNYFSLVNTNILYGHTKNHETIKRNGCVLSLNVSVTTRKTFELILCINL